MSKELDSRSNITIYLRLLPAASGSQIFQTTASPRFKCPWDIILRFKILIWKHYAFNCLIAAVKKQVCERYSKISCQKQTKLGNCVFICTLTIIFPDYFLVTQFTGHHFTPANVFCFTTIFLCFLFFVCLLAHFPMPAITRGDKRSIS